MKLIVLVFVSLFNGSVRDMAAFPYTSLEACEEGRKEAAAELVKPPVIPGLEFRTTCVDMGAGLKPQVDPAHRDPKSERRS